MAPPCFGSPSSTAKASQLARESRRAASRREVLLPCQVVRETDFVLVADRTLDVSVEGMLVPMRRAVAVGESLIVSFQIPGIWIDAEAIVTRVVHNRRPGDDGLAFGLYFDRIMPSARAALAGFLHGPKAPLPRRGPLSRLRRGEFAPRLADEAMMLRSDLHEIDPSDVEDLAEDELLEEDTITCEPPPSSGLELLRAVLDAWQKLADEATEKP